jgi:site-specific DNA-adenine methylase
MNDMTSYHTCKIPRLIPYYGAKHSIARKYPPPEYPTIIEPFAGSAAYSSLYSDREIILIDKDPIIAGIWKWLIGASEDEILELPIDPTRRVS